MSVRLSIVVVVHRMSRQAENTLRSFAAPYQLHMDPADFEIIVVENESEDLLGEERACAIAPNIRFFLRANEGRSPVPALVFGIGEARSDHLGLVIDGARMVTPRVLHYASAAFRITEDAVVAIPGYHLGANEQHRNPGHDEEVERRLLARINWLTDGYRLFEVSTFFRGRHQHGYLLPLMESNCVFFSRSAYEQIGGVETRFDMVGGGMVNLDLYKRLVERRGAQLFVTPGEGTFHQFHGGVTTTASDDREDLLAAFRDQYAQIRGTHYTFAETPHRLLGAVTGWALPALEFSSSYALRTQVPP